MININKETQQFIIDHELDDVQQLALRSKSYPLIDMPTAIQQIAARKIAKHKIPSWYHNTKIIYPKHLSMEQCSSESTALYKASLSEGDILVDLTGGLGVDFSFLAKKHKRAYYVETQKDLTKLAECNFNTLNLKQATIIQDDAIAYLTSFEEIADTIFIDPARRNVVGRKTVLIEDCTPNLLEIDHLLESKANLLIIKLSPMLDISRALISLKNVHQVHIISVNNECKELLFIKNKSHKNDLETKLICVNIVVNKKDEYFSFTKTEEITSRVSHTETLDQYLYEPNASILKGGAYKILATRYNLKKLHPNSHLYTSESDIVDFPGRKFKVKEVINPNKKEIKSHFQNITKANITTRNYPFSVAEIRKQTKLKEGGIDYIFATTLANEKKVLILCQKVID